jgi:hypothetical protein
LVISTLALYRSWPKASSAAMTAALMGGCGSLTALG